MDSKLISALVDGSRKRQSQPWPVCSFDKDFILVSEFCELVGPRPVLTIPEDGGASFNTNVFSVRIMSVDCTAQLSVDSDAKKGGFQTAGDTQVFLMEPSEGAVAYVHHFTLYDIHARGYVRPFCMAYITSQCSKIMNNFALFRDRFSRISAHFKFGNAIVFLQDLQRRFEYLQYTKRKLSENLNGVPIGKVYEMPRGMKGFNFDDIQGCIEDTIELKKIMFQYIKDECFSEQRKNFSNQIPYHLEENLNGADDVDGLPCLEILNEKYSSLEPWSVGITSGRRFDVQLRELLELCEPCKDEAFSLLKSTRFLFSRTQLLEDFTAKSSTHYKSNDSKEDRVDSKPPDSTLNLAHRDSFLASRKKFHPILNANLWEASHQNVFSIFSFDRSPFWNFSTSSSRSDSFEVIRANQGSSDEDYVSLRDSDSVSSTPVSVLSFGSPGHMEYQTSNIEHPPGNARRVTEDPSGNARRATEDSGSALTKRNSHSVSRSSNFSDEVDFGFPRRTNHSVSWEGGCPPFEKDNKQRSEEGDIVDQRRNSGEWREMTRRQTSVDSSKSSSSTTSGSKSRRMRSPVKGKIRSESRTSNGSAANKSSAPNLPTLFHMPGAASNSYHEIKFVALRKVYPFLPHLIYSLMIGRPVIVTADRDNKLSVQSLLFTLLPCVPSYPQDKNCVIFWTKGPLHISNLATVKLVGLSKSRNHGEAVPASIQPYVSILDLETSTLIAPPYSGRFLHTCFDAQKEWPSESVFLEYLHSELLELSNQAMMVFVWQFVGHSNGMAFRGSNVDFDYKRFLETKFEPDDQRIINYLVKIIKDVFLCNYVKSITDGDDSEDHGAFGCVDHTARLFHSETPSVKLNLLKTQVFTDTHTTKRK